VENLNENLNTVFDLCQKKYDYNEIFEILKSGSVMEKQVAVLSLNEIRSHLDAEILISNLTGIDGKVRQVVAYKILQLMPEYKHFFLNKDFYDIFSKSIVDIDSNVCRLIIDAVSYLKTDVEFCAYIANKMKDIISCSLVELKKIPFRAKKYTSNKQYFKIYWCLETLVCFYSYLEKDDLFFILDNCSKLPEYTIREKCAVILKFLSNKVDFADIYASLLNDENYYVRNV